MSGFANVKDLTMEMSNKLHEDIQTKLHINQNLLVVTEDQRSKIQLTIEKSISLVRKIITDWQECYRLALPEGHKYRLEMDGYSKEVLHIFDSAWRLRMDEVTAFLVEQKKLEEEIVRLRKELHIMKMSHQIGTEAHKHNIEVKKLEQKITALQYQLQHANHELSELRELKTGRVKQLSSRAKEMEINFNERLKALQIKMNDSKANLERTLKNVRQKNITLHEENEHRQAEANQLRMKLNKMSADLEKKNNMVHKLNAHMSQLAGDENSASAQAKRIRDLEYELRHAKMAPEAGSSAIGSLKSEVDEFHTTLKGVEKAQDPGAVLEKMIANSGFIRTRIHSAQQDLHDVSKSFETALEQAKVLAESE